MEKEDVSAEKATSKQAPLLYNAKGHSAAEDTEFPQYKAAGVCFYVWHPSNQQLHVLLIKEEKTKKVPRSPSGTEDATFDAKSSPIDVGGGNHKLCGTELHRDSSVLSIDYWNFPGGKRRKDSRCGPIEQHPAVTAAREVEEESHSLLQQQRVEEMIRVYGPPYWWQPGKYLLFLCPLQDAWDLPAQSDALVKAGRTHPQARSVKQMVWMPLSQVKRLLERKSPQPHKTELKVLAKAIGSNNKGNGDSVPGIPDGSVGLHFSAFQMLKSGVLNWLEIQSSSKYTEHHVKHAECQVGHSLEAQRSSIIHQRGLQRVLSPSASSAQTATASAHDISTSYFNTNDEMNSRKALQWSRMSPPVHLSSKFTAGDHARTYQKSVLQQETAYNVVHKEEDEAEN